MHPAIPHYGLLTASVAAAVVYALFSSQPLSTSPALTLVCCAVWSVTAVFALPNLLGLLVFGPPETRNRRCLSRLASQGWPDHAELRVVYVSRGDQPHTLNGSVRETLRVLDLHRIPYHIEVVVDQACPGLQHPRVTYHQVPEDYRTPNESRFKARALHWLSRQREAVPGVWVLHLDEESLLTEEALAGIASFVSRHRCERVIGQGEIQYNAGEYGRRWLITACDAVRTGDDLGRFRFQYRLGFPLWGMHGSYVLLPSTLEREIGFDFGPSGSITEDAYLAIEAAGRGVGFDWVDGPIVEQSPQNLVDLLKQRRRWFCGLWSLSLDRRYPMLHRAALATGMCVWSVAWLCPVLAAIKVAVIPGGLPMGWGLFLALVHGTFMGVYMLGCYRQLRRTGYSWAKKAWILVRTALLVPVATLVEGTAVVYAITRPVRGFYVVAKD